MAIFGFFGIPRRLVRRTDSPSSAPSERSRQPRCSWLRLLLIIRRGWDAVRLFVRTHMSWLHLGCSA